MDKRHWSGAELCTLAELWHVRRLSARAVAAMIPGKSRDAILGQARRLGLSPRIELAAAESAPGEPAAQWKDARARIASKLGLIVRRAEARRVPRKPVARAFVPPEPSPSVIPDGVRLKPARFDACQWIEGDPKLDPTMCGAQVLGGAYCRAHYARSIDWPATLNAAARATRKLRVASKGAPAFAEAPASADKQPRLSL